MPLVGFYALFFNSIQTFGKTFSNLEAFGKFSNHPNYKLLGPFWSNYYRLRVFVWGYMCVRITRFFYSMTYRWYMDKGDPHYFWYYDNLYPDFLRDPDDSKYINFPYSDQPVAPDEMIAYFPWEHLKYQKFLDQKSK